MKGSLLAICTPKLDTFYGYFMLFPGRDTPKPIHLPQFVSPNFLTFRPSQELLVGRRSQDRGLESKSCAQTHRAWAPSWPLRGAQAAPSGGRFVFSGGFCKGRFWRIDMKLDTLGTVKFVVDDDDGLRRDHLAY